MWMVVGLGNPGPKYAATRHNMGFRVVDTLASRVDAAPMRSKLGADVGEGRLGDERILLCKPMEFMNTSGQAVMRVAQFWKIQPARTAVVYDDLDLPAGRLKLGAGGGHGGHNGVRSIIAEWGTADFLRVRCGIGRPPAGHDPVARVLQEWSGDEQQHLAEWCSRAAQAVETIITGGLTVAMNRFNTKPGSKPTTPNEGGA